jgi:thiol-disulfide isomerase/thioredoxin
LSCNKDENIDHLNTEKKLEIGFKNITMIFNKAPKKRFLSLKDNNVLGGRFFFSNISSYRDSNGLVHYINPKRTPYVDTLQISVNSPTTEVYFEQFGLEGFSYLFYNGDTVLIDYERGKPKIKILNRKAKPYDYSFENFKEAFSKDTLLTSFDRVFRHLPYPSTSEKISKEEYLEFLDKELKKNAVLLAKTLTQQKKGLDSLYNIKKISKNIHEYYTRKLEYINWSMLAKLKVLPYGQTPVKSLDKKFGSNNSIEKIFTSTNRLEKNSVVNIIQSGDSLLKYKFYTDFLNDSFLPNYVENKTTKTTYTYDNFGGSYYSWDKVFDSIQKSKLYPKNVKDFLLYRYMDKISRDMKSAVVKNYYEKFKKHVNTIYSEIINNTYKIDTTVSSDLILKDSLNNHHSLESILKENKGKVIYLDFWASWCQPCIREISYKKELKTEYKSKNVVFISISIDKDTEKWKSSQVFKQAAEISTHNYLSINPISSDFVKENHLIYIPRYFLYDKKGNLLYPNAPAPHTKKIRTLIDKLLNKSY